MTSTDDHITPPKPPAGLQKPGKALWQKIAGTWELNLAELETLHLACRTADRLAEMEAQVAAEGLTLQGRNGTVIHPLLAQIRLSTAALDKLIAHLRIPAEEEEPLPMTYRQRQASNAARIRWSRQ